MPARTADATWNGNLSDGNGTMEFGSGAYRGNYSAKSRFEEGEGTNPEELIGAAHAGCYSMALSNMLAEAGSPPERIHTTATVHLEDKITRIDLETEGEVPGIDEAAFQKHAASAKENCPVSQALAGTEITLQATLL